MTKAEYQRRKIRELLKDGGHVTWADLRAAGVERRAVIGMLNSGELERADHNIYRLAAASLRFPHWAAVAAKYPNFVVCLLSAAQYHGLTDQVPSQTWVGLPVGSKPSNPSIRCVQWPSDPASNRMWTVGIETVTDGPHTYKVTDPARTVVDLYRWRDRLGEGDRILAEALAEYDRRGFKRSDLYEVGSQFGVANAISELLVLKGHLEHVNSAF